MADNYNDIVLDILKAVDIISTEKVSDLPYDKTVVGEIVSNINAKKGEYTISNSSSEFIAYSDKTDYAVGTKVYITIPNGEWDSRKIIKGKYVSDDTEYYTYTSPLNDFLDITDNLVGIGNEGQGFNPNVEYGLTANGTRSKIIWAYGTPQASAIDNFLNSKEGILIDYTRLALAANFRTMLRSFGTYAGTYGLLLRVYSYKIGNASDSETKYQSIQYEFDFPCNKFFGNPYGLDIAQRQEILFDISHIKDPIIGLTLEFYQNGNFYGSSGALLPAQDMSVNPPAEIPNIFVSNLYVSLGAAIDTYIIETPLLYCLDSKTYVSTMDVDLSQANKRRLDIRWIHEATVGSGDFYCIDQYNEIPYYVTASGQNEEQRASKGILQLYKMETAPEGESTPEVTIAGPGWKLIDTFEYQQTNSNKISREVVLDHTKQTQQFKVVLVYPTPEYADDRQSEDDAVIEAKQEFLAFAQAFQTAVANDEPEFQFKFNNEQQYQTYTHQSAQLKLNRLTADYQQLLNDLNINPVYYESDIITFVNESEVPNYVTLDLINGLQVVCDTEQYNGNFQCYRQDNKIVNSSDANKNRLLRAIFNSVRTGIEEYDAGPTVIHWYIPINRTMIQYPQSGTEYLVLNDEYKVWDAETNNFVTKIVDNNFKQDNPDLQYIFADSANVVTDINSKYYGMFEIVRSGVDINSKAIGKNTPQQLEQIFRIKDVYSYNANENIVYCEIEKNNRVFSAQYEMTFGISGNNGTKYTFNLEFANHKNSFEPFSGDTEFTVIPHIYDYKNREITEQYKNQIRYSWYSRRTIVDSDNYIFEIDPASEAPYCNILYKTNYITSLSRDDIVSSCNYYILQAQVQPQSSSTYLTAYLPIAISVTTDNSRFHFPYIDGTSLISYNSNGTDPVYFKDPFVLYRENMDTHAIDVLNQTWSISLGPDTEILKPNSTTNTANQFYPSVENNILRPTSILMSGIGKNISIICRISNIIRWIQPIIISQYGYESDLLNAWDGSLNIDTENGTILSAMQGAGIKNPDNTFSGVLMGDVGTKTKYANTDIGLYGFYHGAQSYGLKVDGTAFIGRSGTGRIEFNGNNGTIQSASFDANKTGMSIDLDDGVIDIRGTTKTLKQTVPYYEYITDDNGVTDTVHTNNVEYTYTTTGGQVKIQAVNPYLQIKSDYTNPNANTEQEKGSREILYVGSDRIDITTHDYSPNASGVKIHLGGTSKTTNGDFEDDSNGDNINNKGYIKAYGDFTLSALKTVDNKEQGVVLSSSGNPYLRIRHNSNTLLNVTSSAFLMQSPDFSSGDSASLASDATGQSEARGISIDLVQGKIQARKLAIATEQFHLKAATTTNNITTGIQLNSTGNPYIAVEYTPEVGSLKNLFYINGITGNYYLQTKDFNATAGAEAGVKIDLGAGKIEAYNNFKIYAKNTSSTYGGSYIQLQNSSPYLTIHAKQTSTDAGVTTTRENDLIKIADNNYFLQSLDYSTSGKGAGTQIDLTKGIITSYNFKILAYNAADVSDPNVSNENTRWIQISSQKSNASPLAIGTGTGTSENSAKFHVEWDGTLHATGAQFSNTNVDIDSGTVGSWIIDSGGHLYYATGSSPDIKNSTVLLSALGVTNNSLSANYKLSSDLLVSTNTDKPFMIKAGANFAVSTDGTVYAKAGIIGGWSISNKELSKLVKDSNSNNKYYTYFRSPIETPSDDTVSIGVFIWGTPSNGGNATWLKQFAVTYGGKMFAKQADIEGKITATSGYIGGTTGWNIASTSIYNGMTSLSDTTNNGVYLGIDGIALGKGAFKVTNAGALTATSGTIGGWAIKTDWLERKTDDYNVYLYAPTNISGSNKAFYVGTISSGTQTDQFYVTYDGKMYAKNAEISGKITATSGKIGDVEIDSNGNLDISGKISAAIGDFDFVTTTYLDSYSISADHIKVGDSSLDFYGPNPTYIVTGVDGNNSSNYFYALASGNVTISGSCSVDGPNGAVYAGTCSITFSPISKFGSYRGVHTSYMKGFMVTSSQ